MKYFLDVAATQHMTKSAARLCVAQSALSRSIAHLEDELGVRLFDRVGRGLRLTDQGRALQSRLSPLVAELDRVKEDLSAGPAADREVRVRLGAASRIAADAIALWMGEDDRRRISLTQLAEPSSVEADVVIDSSPPDRALRTSAYSERLMLAAPVGERFAESPVAFRDLADAHFISLSSSSGFGRFVSALCEENGFHPRVSFESDNPSVVRKMIGLGLGVGFWPEFSWGARDDENVAFWPLAVSRRREVHVSLMPRAAHSAQAESFFACVCRHFDECFR